METLGADHGLIWDSDSLPPGYLLHSHGQWPIEIDDFPSCKPPFMVGIFHGYVK